MIGPSKYATVEQSILALGARLLNFLEQPMTEYRLWQIVRKEDSTETFPRFVAALDLLFTIRAIEQEGSTARIARRVD